MQRLWVGYLTGPFDLRYQLRKGIKRPARTQRRPKKEKHEAPAHLAPWLQTEVASGCRPVMACAVAFQHVELVVNLPCCMLVSCTFANVSGRVLPGFMGSGLALNPHCRSAYANRNCGESQGNQQRAATPSDYGRFRDAANESGTLKSQGGGAPTM